MKKEPVQELTPSGRKNIESSLMWSQALGCLFLLSVMVAFLDSWGSLAPAPLLIFTGVFALVLCGVGELLVRSGKGWGRFLWLLPWPFLAWLLVSGGWNGLMAWLNVLILRWNEANNAGVQLFQTRTQTGDIAAVTLILAVLQGELIWFLVHRRKILGLCAFGLFWLMLVLYFDIDAAFPCAFFLTGMLGTALTGSTMNVSDRGKFWTLTAAVVLCAAAFVVSRGKSEGTREFREQVTEGLHVWRYGKQVLPEGDLRRSELLKGDEEQRMIVQSAQEKNLYLKSYEGAVCENGQWKGLPESAYGGDNSGMLEWLREQKLDPLFQSAYYYKLSDTEEKRVEPNHLQILVSRASRDSFYAPESLEQVLRGKNVEEKDGYLRSGGFFGADEYSMVERSDYRPAELTVAADWVSRPENEEQKAYLEAEAVYRGFVYARYTQVDSELEKLVYRWFWEDYETESTGIYSAVSRVRKRLQEEIRYTEEPVQIPEGEKNPIRWFLTESGAGNAAWYASAAVEAFRSYGIPARYAEGYYVSQSALAESEDGRVTLTGEDGHAWVELYFDGVGWLPVDVTPGYYYDAVKLQQMVSAPDEVHKTAALEDSIFGADEVTDLSERNGSRLLPPVQVMLRGSALVLGGLAVLLLLGTLLVMFLELLRMLRLQAARRREERMTPMERAEAEEVKLFQYLSILGIEASLGWQTDEIGKQVAEHCGNLKSEEYKRVSTLLEKTVYGGLPLEPYEERTVESFLEKLREEGRNGDLRTKLRLRYSCLKRK